MLDSFSEFFFLYLSLQKISVLQHAPSTHLPTRPGDPKPTSRNLDPLLHPFSRARERTRALNAAKLERMFAKPFLGSLEGHIDAVECLTRRSGSLNVIASGSWDGGEFVQFFHDNLALILFDTKGLVVHNIAQRSHLFKTDSAHKGKISGICFSPEQNSYRLLTCGVDRNIKLWDTRPTPDEDEGDENGAGPSEVCHFYTKFVLWLIWPLIWTRI